MRRVVTSPTVLGFTLACALTSLLVGAGGCEKTTHDNIDKWVNTEKGPKKLKKALSSGSNSASLRGHAAANLIRISMVEDVLKAFDKMSESDRQAVLAELTPRLWKFARLDDPMAQPQTLQSGAKDAMFHLRKYANDANRDKLDNYLIDWLTGGYYDGRAKSGAIAGSAIIGSIGAKAGARMRQVLARAISAPAEKRFKIGLPTLLGVAVTGEAESVELVLRTAEADLGDPELRARCFNALHAAYVKPASKYYKPANPAALRAHIKRLQKVMMEAGPHADVAMDLIRMAGPPDCLEPFLLAISRGSSSLTMRYVAAQHALACGKLAAIIRVAEAFPTTGSYTKDDLASRLWADMVRLQPRQEVAKHARTLLNSDSWVARLTGIELLERLELAATAASDAALVKGVRGQREKLRGWWGDPERKPTPTLGERAKQVAKRLEELAKDPKK